MVLQCHEAEERLSPIQSTTLAAGPQTKAAGRNQSLARRDGSTDRSVDSESSQDGGILAPLKKSIAIDTSLGAGRSAEEEIPKIIKLRTLRLRNIKLQACDKVVKVVKHALRLKKLDLAYN